MLTLWRWRKRRVLEFQISEKVDDGTAGQLESVFVIHAACRYIENMSVVASN